MTAGRLPLLDKLLNLPFLKEQDHEFSLDLHSIKVENGDISLSAKCAKRSGGNGDMNADVDIERMRGERLRAFHR